MSTKEITTQRQSLYPQKDTLREAQDFATAQLPITDVNQLTAVLMTYHNTFVYVQIQENKNAGNH
jgi:hypothetical protein